MSAEQEDIIQEAISRHSDERAAIKSKVLDAAVAFTNDTLTTVGPSTLAVWWLEVFDALAIEDLVFTDTECDQRVEDAVYQTVAGDEI